jgi:hypothetical protein
MVAQRSQTENDLAYSFTFTVSTREGELTCACLTSFDYTDSEDETASNSRSGSAFSIIITSKHALPTQLRERNERFFWKLRPEEKGEGKKSGFVSLPTQAQLCELALPISMKEVEPQYQNRFESAKYASRSMLFSTLDLALPVVDFSMRVLFEHFSLGAVLDIFRCVLLENRVIIISRSLTTVAAIAHAVRALILPLVWCHSFIPVLPEQMMESLECPAPYIIGVHDHAFAEWMNSERDEEGVLSGGVSEDKVTGLGNVLVAFADTGRLQLSEPAKAIASVGTNGQSTQPKVPTSLLTALKALFQTFPYRFFSNRRQQSCLFFRRSGSCFH